MEDIDDYEVMMRRMMMTYDDVHRNEADDTDSDEGENEEGDEDDDDWGR